MTPGFKPFTNQIHITKALLYSFFQSNDVHFVADRQESEIVLVGKQTTTTKQRQNKNKKTMLKKLKKPTLDLCCLRGGLEEDDP